MDKQELLSRMEVIFREVLRRQDIVLTETTVAKDVAGWDSLSNMTLIVRIEEEFKCRFNFREIMKFRNVGDLRDAILTKIGN